MAKKNISVITVLESFLCAFVVFIHIASEGISNARVGGLFWSALFVCTKLVSFVVPAFIFSSAFKMAVKYKDKKISYLKFIWDRIRRIYIPYLGWVLIFYLFFVYRMQYFAFDLPELLRYMLNGTLVAHFYFIIIIMQFYILMPLLLWCYKKMNPALALVLAFAISLAVRLLNQYHTEYFTLLDAPSICFFYLVFWTMGSYAALYYNRFAAFIKARRARILAAAAVVAAVHISLSYSQFAFAYDYSFAEAMHLIFCIAMTLGLFVFLEVLTPVFERCMGFFKTVAGVSFYIYLSHILVIFITDIYLQRYAIPLIPSFLIKAALTYTIPFVLSLTYVRAKRGITQKKFR